jgi:nicotinamidase-related amidase
MSAPALLLIDVQRAFEDPSWGERNNPGAEANVARALAGWRDAGLQVVHVRHSSPDPNGRFKPGTPGFEFKPEAAPLEGEPVITKSTNSAFVGTGLEELLRERGIDAVAVAGLTTDHCCSATTRSASDLGFTAWVLGDAMATHERVAPDGEHLSAELMHRAALASLNEEFGEVIDTAEALARLSD